ncbi:uncharacterized protein EI90DRAFT_907527 [Cantharellus anzutake]|uniref:uncharacterized protein n=1 Tax=Cantharellus anzutake TaxID=1750568 RepID=UPI0019040076|nr:uncharacterized protein EI90DRAFT_907527 [Cantharellus anzutake]KAF8331971.1 hypothetical protein EI90DRAFT_907527 [Cantharellus anzutake]
MNGSRARENYIRQSLPNWVWGGGQLRNYPVITVICRQVPDYRLTPPSHMPCHRLLCQSNSVAELFKHYRLDGWDEAAYEREYEKELAQECGTCTFGQPVNDDGVSFTSGSPDYLHPALWTPMSGFSSVGVDFIRGEETRSLHNFHILPSIPSNTNAAREGLPSDRCGLPRRASDIALYPSATNKPKFPPSALNNLLRTDFHPIPISPTPLHLRPKHSFTVEICMGANAPLLTLPLSCSS